MFQRIKILLFTSFFVGAVFGQKIEEDLALITKKMQESKSFSFAIDIAVYTKKGGAAIYKTTASLDKMGKDMKYVLGDMTMVSSKGYDVRIDHEEHAVLIQKRSNVKIQKPANFDLDLKRLKEQLEKHVKSSENTIHLISGKKSERIYQVTGIPGFREMIIALDMERKVIKYVEYQYDKNYGEQYATLKYSGFSYNKDLSGKFDLATYFTVKNNTYVLSNSLKGFKIYTEE